MQDNILNFGEKLKESFGKLDEIVKNSALSEEQKAGILKTRHSLESAIANQDEKAIMETVKNHINGTNN